MTVSGGGVGASGGGAGAGTEEPGEGTEDAKSVSGDGAGAGELGFDGVGSACLTILRARSCRSSSDEPSAASPA